MSRTDTQGSTIGHARKRSIGFDLGLRDSGNQLVVMMITGMIHRIELIAGAKPAPFQPCPG